MRAGVDKQVQTSLVGLRFLFRFWPMINTTQQLYPLPSCDVQCIVEGVCHDICVSHATLDIFEGTTSNFLTFPPFIPTKSPSFLFSNADP